MRGSHEEKPKKDLLYVLINGELKMSPGKVAAQTVHAIGELNRYSDEFRLFSYEPKRTVIVLEAKDSQQIINFKRYLEYLNIKAGFYVDEGANEVSPYSITAMAIGPLYTDDEETREIFKPFSLYPRRKAKWYKRLFK